MTSKPSASNRQGSPVEGGPNLIALKVHDAPVPDDAFERAEFALASVGEWLFGDAMSSLLAEYDYDVTAARGRWEAGDRLAAIAMIEEVAEQHFDFRAHASGTYRERWHAATADIPADRRARIEVAAGGLGLLSTTAPRYTRYDGTLVLGAGQRSPLLRAQFTASIAAQAEIGEIYLLGSPRFVQADEAEVVGSYALGAVDEFDLMTAAAQSALNLHGRRTKFLCGCAAADAICPAWPYAAAEAAAATPPQYTHEREAQLHGASGSAWVLSASTSRPPNRPNTADTLGLWLKRVQPGTGYRVLVVTTQVFVPFQTFDALRRLYLSRGVGVDVVGFGAEWGDRPKTAEYLLQEVLSGIRSAHQLAAAASEQIVQVGVQAGQP